MRSASGNLVRTREWHQIKCFHQYLMVRPHQAEWKALHQSKAQWLADMRHYSPSLPHDRALDLFNEHFERMGTADLWRMRFNRRSANPLEWISVDFFSKGRALDPSFLRFLMGMTWQMKTPAFRAAIDLEEFTRDRTEEEDKEAKDTFLLAHRFLYDSCPQGLRVEVAGLGDGATATATDSDTDEDDAENDSKGQQQHRIMALLEEWEARGLVATLETSPAKKVYALAREALDLITYDSPLLPSILRALPSQRPEATQQYQRIIAKEANSRTCFFRLYKNSRFLTLFGPLKPDLAALIEAAPASYYSSSHAAAAGGGGGGSSSSKRPRAHGSVYTGFKKRPLGGAAAASSSLKKPAAAAVKKSARLPKREQGDFYYYDDDDDLGDVQEEDEEEEEEEDGRKGKEKKHKKREEGGGGGRMSLEVALGLTTAARPSHHQYYYSPSHQHQHQHQPWTLQPTTTMMMMTTTAAAAPPLHLPSPADDLTTTSSSAASSTTVTTPAWAQEPWVQELDDCLNRWFPNTHEGDDKTMYEPPVDPDDVFERWCRENMVVAGGMGGYSNSTSNSTTTITKSSSSIGSSSSSSSGRASRGKGSSALTSPAASLVMVEEQEKVPYTSSTTRSGVSFSSSSTTVATQVEEGGEGGVEEEA